MAAIVVAGLCLLGLVLVAQEPAVAQDPGEAGDFNADGIVDTTDFSLLRDAQGGEDLAYDLDGDGVVDLQDVFIFAELYEGESATDTEGEEPELPYKVLVTRHATAIALPHFSAIVQPAEPFGITSLRMHGQPVDFVAPGLSIGDWEWFWFYPAGADPEKLQIKLLTSHWGSPSLVREREHVELTFRRRNTLRAGVGVEVKYWFSSTAPRFDVVYQIANNSGHPLHAPYAMVGFPGFSDHRWVSEVADARRVRRPTGRHGYFLSEALASRAAEYVLLRHDVAGGVMEGLMARVTMDVDGGSYVLNGYFLPTPGLAQVHSMQTNKPRYLTSHLYATYEDLPHQQSRSLHIAYVLERR